MANETNNPIDDELLKELGLEPAAPKAATPSMTRPSVKRPVEPPPAQPPIAKAPVSPPARTQTPAPSQAGVDFFQGVTRASQNLPIQVVAVLGKKTLTLKEVLELKQGEVLELNRLPKDAVDLVANGKLIARGDLVLVEGKVGIQIRQLVG